MSLATWFSNHFGNRNQTTNQIGSYGNLNTSIQSFLSNGTNVTEDDVMKIPAVQAAIELITGTVGQLPIKLYTLDKNGMPTPVKDDYRLRILNKEANSHLDGYAFKRKVTWDYLLYGMSKSKVKYLSKTSNHIMGLYPMNAKDLTIQIYTTDGVDRYGKTILNNNSGSYEFNDDYLLSVLRDTSNGITGRGILDSNNSVFGLALAQIKYEKSLMENGATPSGVIELPDRTTSDIMQQVVQGWNKTHSGADNAGHIAILSNGAQYKAISTSPDKLQLNNAKKNVISDVARIFNIPESLINAGANKYKSNEQDSIYFVQNCLKPILAAEESAFDKALLSLTEKNHNYFFRYDTSNIINSTFQDNANAVSTMYNNGIISLKEARRDCGYNNITKDDYDFIKLSQGNVLLDTDNNNLEILNKGEVTTGSDLTTIKNDGTADDTPNNQSNDSQQGDNNDKNKDQTKS